MQYRGHWKPGVSIIYSPGTRDQCRRAQPLETGEAPRSSCKECFDWKRYVSKLRSAVHTRALFPWPRPISWECSSYGYLKRPAHSKKCHTHIDSFQLSRWIESWANDVFNPYRSNSSTSSMQALAILLVGGWELSSASSISTNAPVLYRTCTKAPRGMLYFI